MTTRATTTIGELIDNGTLMVSDGYRTRRSELGTPGFRIIRVADIGDGTVSLDGPDFVSEDRSPQIGSKIGQAGDVLLTTKGTVGRVAVLPTLDHPVVYSPQVCFFRLLNQSTLDHRYLRYWFGSPEFWRQASDRMNNTDMAAYINLADVRSLALELPPIEQQAAIAEVLGALDEKIAANTKAEGILTALFKATFLQCVDPKSARIALGDMAQTTKGVSYRSVDLIPSSTALVTLKSIQRDGGYSKRGLKPYAGHHKEAQVVKPGEIVVAQTDLTQAADIVGRAAQVRQSDDYRTLVASLDLVIVRPRAGHSREFLLGILLDDGFREHCRARTSGTTVLHLAADAMASYMAPAIPADVEERFTAAGRSILATRDSLANERQRLGVMRDNLLPALLSGRLHVRDAERAIEVAV